MNTVRRLILLAGLTLALSAPAAAQASPGPHVSLQTGPRACELQAAMENFPPGTVQLVFRSTSHTPVRFPVIFTGDEGGSDVLITAGPFAPGTWTARVAGAQRQGKVTLGDECGPPAASTTSTTARDQGGQTPTTSGAPTTSGHTPASTARASSGTLGTRPAAGELPFTGTDPWPLFGAGLGALVIGGYVLWRVRARRA